MLTYCFTLHASIQRNQTWAWLRVESWVDSESKWFSLESWVDLNRKMRKHFESRVDLNQYLGNPLELWLDSIPGKPLSHELNWFKYSRCCLSHELIRIKTLELNAEQDQWNLMKAHKMSTKFSESPKKTSLNEIKWKPKILLKSHFFWQLLSWARGYHQHSSKPLWVMSSWDWVESNKKWVVPMGERNHTLVLTRMSSFIVATY